MLRPPFSELCMDRSTATVWELSANGGLIRRVGPYTDDVIVTTVQNMRHQQNVAGQRPDIEELISTVWPRIRHQIEANCVATKDVQPAHMHEVPVPSEVL